IWGNIEQADLMKWSRLISLNAFRKSIFIKPSSEPLVFWMQSRKECATTSTPPGHPTPRKASQILSRPAMQKHLATRRRIGSPQHSGRTEVAFFSHSPSDEPLQEVR